MLLVKGRNVVTAVAIFVMATLGYAAMSTSSVGAAIPHALVARGVTSPSNSELLHNTVAFGVPAGLLFMLRITNAIWVVKRMHFEDYLMMLAMCFYVCLLVLINISANYATNLYPPEMQEAILASPQEVDARVFGSKLVIPLEQCMLASTWCIKICIWLFLYRLCRQLRGYQRALKWLLGYIVTGYVVIMLVYYVGFCRPFSQYWAVPVQNSECATYQHYSIVQMVFNISSDIGLIIIPVMLFWTKAHSLPMGRRVALSAVFSMAVFTIIAAILNKVYNFASPLTTVYQLWYIREASVSIWVGNIICCWQIIQKVLRARSFDNKSANIVMQPEIHNPAFDQRSDGGSPKTSDWWKQWGARARARGDRVPHASKMDMGTGASNDSATLVGREKGGMSLTTYQMTVNKDGDDARDALRYRAENDIV